MVKKQLWWTPTDISTTEPIPVNNDQQWWAIVTAANLKTILQHPEFAEIRNNVHTKINYENTVVAIVTAAELWFDASSTAKSDDESWDTPPSET